MRDGLDRGKVDGICRVYSTCGFGEGADGGQKNGTAESCRFHLDVAIVA